MRQRVLLVAAELDLRARFARELQSSGYAVELASDVKRALRLAAKDHFRIAVVAPGPSLAGGAIGKCHHLVNSGGEHAFVC